MSHHARATRTFKVRNLLPLDLGDKIRDRLAFDVGLQAQEPRHRLVEIKDPSVLIHHQHSILDRVEQRLQKRPFPRQPLHHRLQTLRIEPSNPAQDLVEKTGFGGHGGLS